MVLRTNSRKNRRGLKEKKKERVIYKAPPVMCEYGVKSNYSLVPLELGIGHYCGHMIEYYICAFVQV